MLDEGCVEDYTGECKGEVQYRVSPYSPTGQGFRRCEAHFERVLRAHEDINRRYPDTPTPPDWFDPADAGERWDYDY